MRGFFLITMYPKIVKIVRANILINMYLGENPLMQNCILTKTMNKLSKSKITNLDLSNGIS